MLHTKATAARNEVVLVLIFLFKKGNYYQKFTNTTSFETTK